MNEHILTKPKLVIWNKEHTAFLGGILDRLTALRNSEGGIRYSTDLHASYGPYQTIESLLPLLLFPEKQHYMPSIQAMSRYVLSQRHHDGGFRPYPEYPSWEHSAVDSTAYAIYVFAILRDFLQLNRSQSEDPNYDEICTTIRLGIEFLAKNQNVDKGWGFLRRDDLGLKSRSYSTGLVISALSYCMESDFPDNLFQKDMIRDGVAYLLANQIREGDDAGAWGFGSEHNDPHPNITSVVVFSLCQTYHYNRDRRVEDAVDLGVKYILNHWRMENVAERVRYPTSGGSDPVRIHDFVHPHHMILPAALLSGEVGFADNRVLDVVNKIRQEYERKIDKYDREPLDPLTILKSWELAETAFTLTYYYAIRGVIEYCADLFAHTDTSYTNIHLLESKILSVASEVQKLRSVVRWSRILVGGIIVEVLLSILVFGFAALNREFATWLQERFFTVLTTLSVLLFIPLVLNLAAGWATARFGARIDPKLRQM